MVPEHCGNGCGEQIARKDVSEFIGVIVAKGMAMNILASPCSSWRSISRQHALTN